MATRDPLDELAAAWRGLQPPEPRGDDATTRAAVDWMRAAWRSLGAPATAGSVHDPAARIACTRPGTDEQALPRSAWLLLAAAVLVLVLLDTPPRHSTSPDAEAATGARAVPLLPLAERLRHAAPEPPYTPDALERRHGSVRLIFLDDAGAAERANGAHDPDLDRLPAGDDR